MFKNIKDWLIAIVRVDTWVQIHPYDERWDKLLNELMDKHTFVYIDEYTAKLGDLVIWIYASKETRYCSIHPYKTLGVSKSDNVTAKRATMIRAVNKYKREIISKREDEPWWMNHKV